MNEIEKIKQYIERTNIPQRVVFRYGLPCSEWFALCEEPETLKAVGVAFDYGFAKGYRAGKKAARTGRSSADARRPYLCPGSPGDHRGRDAVQAQ